MDVYDADGNLATKPLGVGIASGYDNRSQRMYAGIMMHYSSQYETGAVALTVGASARAQLSHEQRLGSSAAQYDQSKAADVGNIRVPLVVARSATDGRSVGENVTGSASTSAASVRSVAANGESSTGAVKAWASKYLRSMDPHTTKRFLARDLGALWRSSGVSLMDIRRLLARAVHRGVWDWRSDERIVVHAQDHETGGYMLTQVMEHYDQDERGLRPSGWQEGGWPSINRRPTTHERRHSIQRARAQDLMLIQRYGRAEVRRWRRSIGGQGGAQPHPIRPTAPVFGPSAQSARGPAAVLRSGGTSGYVRGINSVVGRTSPSAGHRSSIPNVNTDDNGVLYQRGPSLDEVWNEFREGDGTALTATERADGYRKEAAAARRHRGAIEVRASSNGRGRGSASSYDYTTSDSTLPRGYRSHAESVGLATKHQRLIQSRAMQHATQLGTKIGVRNLIEDTEMDSIRERALLELPATMVKALDSGAAPGRGKLSNRKQAADVRSNQDDGLSAQGTTASVVSYDLAESMLRDLVEIHVYQAVGRAVMRVSRLIELEDERRSVHGLLPIEATIVLRAGGGMDVADLSEESGRSLFPVEAEDHRHAHHIVTAIKQQRQQEGSTVGKLFRRWISQPAAERTKGARAAIRIQAVWRGWRDRLRVSYIHTLAYGRLRSLSASVVQEWWRSLTLVATAYAEAHSRRQAASTIHRTMAALRDRVRTLRRRASLVVAKAMRRWRLKRVFEHVIMLHRTKTAGTARTKTVQRVDNTGDSVAAARRIQSLYYGTKVRMSIRPVMQARRWARGRICRWLAIMYEDTTVHDSRRLQAMAWFRRCRGAVMMVQAIWRGYAGRRYVRRLRSLQEESTIEIQRIARGFYARYIAAAARHRSEAAWRLVLGRHAGDRRPPAPIRNALRDEVSKRQRRGVRRGSASSVTSVQGSHYVSKEARNSRENSATMASYSIADEDREGVQEARARRAEFDSVRPINRVRWLAEVGRMVVDGTKGSVRSGWVYVHAGSSIDAKDAALMEGIWRMKEGEANSRTMDPSVDTLVASLRAAGQKERYYKLDRRKMAASSVASSTLSPSGSVSTVKPQASTMDISQQLEMQVLRDRLPFLPAALHVEVGRLISELSDAVLGSNSYAATATSRQSFTLSQDCDQPSRAMSSVMKSQLDCNVVSIKSSKQSLKDTTVHAINTPGTRRTKRDKSGLQNALSLTKSTLGSPDWIKQLARARKQAKREEEEQESRAKLYRQHESALYNNRRMTPSMRAQRKRLPAKLRAGGLPVSKLAADDPDVNVYSSLFERMFVSRRPLDTNPLVRVLPGASARAKTATNRGGSTLFALATGSREYASPIKRGASRDDGAYRDQQRVQSTTTNRLETFTAPAGFMVTDYPGALLVSGSKTDGANCSTVSLSGPRSGTVQTPIDRVRATMSRNDPRSPLSPLKPLNSLPSAMDSSTAPYARALIQARDPRLEPLHSRLGKTSEFLESVRERAWRRDEERYAASRAIAYYLVWLEDAGDYLPGHVRSYKLIIRKRAAALVREKVMKTEGSQVLFPEISIYRRHELADYLSLAVRGGAPFNLGREAPLRRQYQILHSEHQGLSMAKRIAKHRGEAQQRAKSRNQTEPSKTQKLQLAAQTRLSRVRNTRDVLGHSVERSLNALAGMVVGMSPSVASNVDTSRRFEPEVDDLGTYDEFKNESASVGVIASSNSQVRKIPASERSFVKSAPGDAEWDTLSVDGQPRDTPRETSLELQENGPSSYFGRIRLASLAPELESLDKGELAQSAAYARHGTAITPRPRADALYGPSVEPNGSESVSASYRRPVIYASEHASHGGDNQSPSYFERSLQRTAEGKKDKVPFDAAGWVAGVQRRSYKDMGRPDSRFVSPIDRATKVLSGAHCRKLQAKKDARRRVRDKMDDRTPESSDQLSIMRDSVGLQSSVASLYSSVSSGSALIDVRGRREDYQVRRLMQEVGGLDIDDEGDVSDSRNRTSSTGDMYGRGAFPRRGKSSIRKRRDGQSHNSTDVDRRGRFPVQSGVYKAAERARSYGSQALESNFGAATAYGTISVIEADGDDKSIPLPGLDKPGGAVGYSVKDIYKSARPTRQAGSYARVLSRSISIDRSRPDDSEISGAPAGKATPVIPQVVDKLATYAPTFEQPTQGRAMGLLAKAVGHMPELPEVVERRMAAQIPVSLRHDLGARQANAELRERSRSRARRNSTQGVVSMLLQSYQNAALNAQMGIGGSAGALAAAQTRRDAARSSVLVSDPPVAPWDSAASMGFKDFARLTDGTGRQAGVRQ